MDDTYRKRTAVLLADVRRRMGDAVCVVFRHHTYDDDTATAALALEAAADQRRFCLCTTRWSRTAATWTRRP
ncbi:hypothetical protein C1Y40_03388 [Mycobacterium talmoniae]|uniref:Uncharacterized protein n=1 Tax=Mycobacterium talmoniae TaxID=1858794 RepID=A0A2S8BID3_9MYCO|nr:hypothetical protein C1Y40_03388 [Mycobacterium talmoniae]